jgi:Uncharacterized ACR, COG1678
LENLARVLFLIRPLDAQVSPHVRDRVSTSLLDRRGVRPADDASQRSVPGPEEAAEAACPSLAGQLLVAAPWIGDPDFERTVVLIVADGPEGAVGIVINKPIGEQPLADGFKALGQKKADVTGGARIFGGPVQPEGGSAVLMANRRYYNFPDHGSFATHEFPCVWL